MRTLTVTALEFADVWSNFRHSLIFGRRSAEESQWRLLRRTPFAMQFELSVVVAAAFMAAAFILDWPRALAGLALGAVCRFLPYGTILIPVGVIVISAASELLYPWLGRTAEPHFGDFLIGVFAVAGTASSLYITIRNLRDRL